ncbi:hypothetical protein [Acidiphilium acidophilum]|uniref:hypothetical protein n=1 Tax=Acidiphilium acidophilum TaxID=76588 RepID=UPI002E8E6DDB|nr:hypothetical protein [Acidiphilium acidophilum]
MNSGSLPIYQLVTIVSSVALALTSIISALSSKKSAKFSSDTLDEAKRLNAVAVSPHCYFRFPYGEYSPDGEWNENIFQKLRVNDLELTLKVSLINGGPAPAFGVVLYPAKEVEGNKTIYERLTKGIILSKLKTVTAENVTGNNIYLSINSDQFETQRLGVPNASQVIDNCDVM